MPEPRPAEIVLVRHGETDWSRDGKHTGTSDIPLNAEGEWAATRLVGSLHRRRFALVLTSPLSRARETCQLAGYAEAAQSRDDLVEIDYGDDDGRTTAEIRAERPGWSFWKEGGRNGESLESASARCDRVLAECRGAEGDVLIFAHGHLLRVLGARWVGWPAIAGAHLSLSTAAISELGWERDTPVISAWNDTSHLRDGGG